MAHQHDQGTRSGVAGDGRDLSPDQLTRWAQLVAEGRETMPEGITPVQRAEMLGQVRRLRGRRLVRYIARQIAVDLHRGRAGRPGE